MPWLFLALLPPFLFAGANILDNYLTNKLFRGITPVVIFGVIFNVIFLPILLLIDLPRLPQVSIIPFIILVGFTNALYLFPYYKALQLADTSIVTSLFSLGKIFVPVLAFLILKESLELSQYAGFLVIIFSAAVLSADSKTRKPNGALLYMALTSLILAVQVVIYKYILNSVDWVSAFFWTSLASFIVILPLFAAKRVRDEVLHQIKTIGHGFRIIFAEEFLTFGGGVLYTLAVSLAPVTLMEGVGSIQPFVVLLYAALLRKRFKSVFKESLTKSNIIKKITLFALIIIGIYLIGGEL